MRAADKRPKDRNSWPHRDDDGMSAVQVYHHNRSNTHAHQTGRKYRQSEMLRPEGFLFQFDSPGNE